MIRHAIAALSLLVAGSVPGLAQVYGVAPGPQSMTGTYLAQPGYGVGQPTYGMGQTTYGTGQSTYGGQQIYSPQGYGTVQGGTGYGYGQNTTISPYTGLPSAPVGAAYGVQGSAYGQNQGYGQANGQNGLQNGQQRGQRQQNGQTRGDGQSAETQAPKARQDEQKRDPRGQLINGFAKVVDGKTLQIGSELVVLNGADAPSIDQTCLDGNGMSWECGRRSFDRLFQLTDGQRVFCVGQSRGTNGTVARCMVGTVDLGKTMVQDGLALSPRAVEPVYLSDESQARTARRGMWLGSFKNPWDARAGR